MSHNNNANTGIKLAKSNSRHSTPLSNKLRNKEEAIFNQVLQENQKLEQDLSLILGNTYNYDMPMQMRPRIHSATSKKTKQVIKNVDPTADKLRSAELRLQGNIKSIEKHQNILKQKEDAIEKNDKELQRVNDTLQRSKQNINSTMQLSKTLASPLKETLTLRKQEKKNALQISKNDDSIKSLEKQLKRFNELNESIATNLNKIEETLKLDQSENDSIRQSRTGYAVELNDIKVKVEKGQNEVKSVCKQCEKYSAIIESTNGNMIVLKEIANKLEISAKQVLAVEKSLLVK
jgi:hypothetical protein